MGYTVTSLHSHHGRPVAVSQIRGVMYFSAIAGVQTAIAAFEVQLHGAMAKIKLTIEILQNGVCSYEQFL